MGVLRRLIQHPQTRHPSESAHGLAISYALGQWEGRVEIDNNTVEQAIRPSAVGKKNCLFVGDRGAIL